MAFDTRTPTTGPLLLQHGVQVIFYVIILSPQEGVKHCPSRLVLPMNRSSREQSLRAWECLILEVQAPRGLVCFRGDKSTYSKGDIEASFGK